MASQTDIARPQTNALGGATTFYSLGCDYSTTSGFVDPVMTLSRVLVFHAFYYKQTIIFRNIDKRQFISFLSKQQDILTLVEKALKITHS